MDIQDHFIQDPHGFSPSTAASWLPLGSRVCTAAIRPVLRESDRMEYRSQPWKQAADIWAGNQGTFYK